MRILFMGTPQIAAQCLQTLLSDGREVVGVVCRADKPQGRGHHMQSPPVKQLAQAYGLPVYQPESVRDPSFTELLRDLRPDLIIVVAYGRILPPEVLSLPPLGCINLHVSLLPRYRGAAPMERAVYNGETETGVTVMHMAQGLDTGDRILTEAFPIAPTEDMAAVYAKAASIGSRLLLRAADLLAVGRAPRIPQDEARATYAPKIEKQDCLLDFTLPARTLCNRVRALSPAPLAFTRLPDGRLLKVASASLAEGTGACGEVIQLNDRGEGAITVACGTGALALHAVVPEGKGRMRAADFIRGRRIQVGDRLGGAPD